MRSLLAQAGRFASVGVLATVVHLGVASVAHLAGEKAKKPLIHQIWEQISATSEHFSEVSWQQIGEEGIELDPTPFLELSFVETKNLKFDPVAFADKHTVAAGA